LAKVSGELVAPPGLIDTLDDGIGALLAVYPTTMPLPAVLIEARTTV
jgi:hypothetical protein